MDHVFNKIRQERDNESDILENQKDYATECIFGIDYDRLIAKVAKAYMLIWGDGRANIATCDSLNEGTWQPDVQAKFIEKASGTKALRQFDIIMTNPPFAGDITSEDVLSKYDLAFRPQKGGARKRVARITRDKLFLERCLSMLRPGGRMAIVLPRGVLKNYTDEYVRRFLLSQASVIGVVSLTGDMFKPFTNTKTCVLFLVKRKKSIDAAKVNSKEKVIYCVSEQPGKDKSGKMIVDEKGNVVSDLDGITKYVTAHLSKNVLATK